VGGRVWGGGGKSERGVGRGEEEGGGGGGGGGEEEEEEEEEMFFTYEPVCLVCFGSDMVGSSTGFWVIPLNSHLITCYYYLCNGCYGALSDSCQRF